MPRLKLPILPGYTHNQTLRVRVTDLNYGGHLATAALVGLLHQARVEILQSLGFCENNLGDERTGLIQTDLAMTLQGECFLHDVIEVKSAITEVKRATVRLCHAVYRNDSLVAAAEMGFAGFDYAKRQPAPLPSAFLAKIQDLIASHPCSPPA